MLTGDLDIGVVCRTAIANDPSQAVGVQSILELPESVTGQVGADEELLAPWQAKSLPSVPVSLENPRSRRHWRGLQRILVDGKGKLDGRCW